MATSTKNGVRNPNIGKDLASVLRVDTNRGGRTGAGDADRPKRPKMATIDEIFDCLNGMTVTETSSVSETPTSNKLSARRRSFRGTCIQYSFSSDPFATRFLTLTPTTDTGVSVVHVTPSKGGEPQVQLKFATPQNYVDLWNETTRAVDLSLRGQLTLQGDRRAARQLSVVMNAARQQAPSNTTTTRKGTLFSLPSFSSFSNNNTSTAVSAPAPAKSTRVASEALASKTVATTSLREGAEYERELDRLQLEVEMLEQKCARLEAQNIVTATQQLDILCRTLAVGISLSCLWLYWKMVWLAFPTVEAHVLQAASDMSVQVPPHALLLAKYVMACFPWYHSGLAHRRIHVFCVFVLMIVRIRMARWRSDLFAKESSLVRGGLDGDNDDNEDDPKPITPSFGQRTDDEDIWEANYEINGRFLYMSILQLRGLWTKSAQYMSSRADFVPKSYVRELSKLQDEAPSTPWPVVKGILQQQGVYDKLTDVDETPIASASIGQVHVARLASTGEKVVVKVQHPHARRLLTDDFRSLQVIARCISWLEPDWKFLEILIQEWANEARHELDFTREMKNLRTAHASAERFMSTCQPLVTNPTSTTPHSVPFALEVPRPYEDLCTRDVLVMSFCEGKRVDNLEYLRQCGLSPDMVMDAVSQCFAYMLYSSPIFNGDPHPGNVFVRPRDGGGVTVVVLDWGLAKRLPEVKRKGFCQMALSAATMDYGLMLDAFRTIGLSLKREDVGQDMENIRFILRDLAPRQKARRRIRSKMETDMKDKTVPVESKAYPGEIFFFVRTNELLHGLGSKLQVDSSYMDIIKPYAERGLRFFLQQESPRPLPPPSPSKVKSMDAGLLSKVQNVLTKLHKEGEIAGAQVCVVNRGGETVLNYCSGHMGGTKSHLPMTLDAVILGFSCTKGVAATLAHVMVQEGYLTYDEPLCQRVWPLFCPHEEPPKAPSGFAAQDWEQGWKWKRCITLRHVLTHTAGLATEFPPRLSLATLASCEQCAQAYEYNGQDTLLPQDEPGTKCAYHFMTYGWILAGALMGAHQVRHKTKITFQDLYEKLLQSKLPPTVVESGFFPCGSDLAGGGYGDHPKADTQVHFHVGRLAQMQREAESMGDDSTLEASDIDDDEGSSSRGGNSVESIQRLRERFQGREFLLDPRMWNSHVVEHANVPAAGGRFSARALAHFYHALGTGLLVRPEILKEACTVQTAKVSQFASLQGGGSSEDTEFESSFGLGYQIIQFDGERAFGHAGIGGSIGLYHFETGTALGVMLNKYDADRGVAMKIVRVLTQYIQTLSRSPAKK